VTYLKENALIDKCNDKSFYSIEVYSTKSHPGRSYISDMPRDNVLSYITTVRSLIFFFCFYVSRTKASFVCIRLGKDVTVKNVVDTICREDGIFNVPLYLRQ